MVNNLKKYYLSLLMTIILIAAACKTKDGKLGIGYNNKIPWNVPEDLAYFKKLTTNNVVVMGRKTYESIGGILPNRHNIILSRAPYLQKCKNADVFNNLDELIKKIVNLITNKKTIFIIGGEKLYNNFINMCDMIYLTEIYTQTICDRFFPEILASKFKLTNYTQSMVTSGYNDTSDKIKYRHLIFKKMYNFSFTEENKYKSILNTVLYSGNKRQDRTNIGTYSSFGHHMEFNISTYAPLLTTKKMAWKTCILELLWFLKGDTNSNTLKSQGVHIWDGNTSREFLDSRGLYDYPEGELGPLYPWQIRYSGAEYPHKKNGIDQLEYILNLLKTDPFSRRIMWNIWIPSDLKKMVLPPCHFAFQLYVELNDNNEKLLNGMVYLRSNDLFLGCPFNIFSYYVLIRILAMKCNMKPNKLHLSICDAHIYSNHIKQVELQLSRNCRTLPILELNDNIKNKDWNDIVIDDFELIGYYPYPAISAPMAI